MFKKYRFYLIEEYGGTSVWKLFTMGSSNDSLLSQKSPGASFVNTIWEVQNPVRCFGLKKSLYNCISRRWYITPYSPGFF